MNLHEYQGKQLFAQYGLPVSKGIAAATVEEAVAAADTIGGDMFVVKAQVHAGGRGKGGGVKLAKNLEQVEEIAGQIIGMQLITPQTSAEGKTVHQVLIAEDVYYPGESETSEFYMSVLLNRGNGRNMIMYSTEGGMDIEEVAEHTPHLIFTEEIDPAVGLQGFQARRIAFNLGLSGNAFKEMVKFIDSLYNAYIASDASMFEINPVLKTSDDKILAVDAKVNITKNCIGIIAWMHTFSPAKMWINALKALHKPMLQLHTQFNRDIPWSSIDMDFMNLNQSEHGDREFGFMVSRMRLNRKVVTGHWENEQVQQKINICDYLNWV